MEGKSGHRLSRGKRGRRRALARRLAAWVLVFALALPLSGLQAFADTARQAAGQQGAGQPAATTAPDTEPAATPAPAETPGPGTAPTPGPGGQPAATAAPDAEPAVTPTPAATPGPGTAPAPGPATGLPQPEPQPEEDAADQLDEAAPKEAAGRPAPLSDMDGATMVPHQSGDKYISNWYYAYSDNGRGAVKTNDQPADPQDCYTYSLDLMGFGIPELKDELVNKITGLLPDWIIGTLYYDAGLDKPEFTDWFGFIDKVGNPRKVYVKVTWNVQAVVDALYAAGGKVENGTQLTFCASPVSPTGYRIRINSNNPNQLRTDRPTDSIDHLCLPDKLLNLTVTVDSTVHKYVNDWKFLSRNGAAITSTPPADTAAGTYTYAVSLDLEIPTDKEALVKKLLFLLPNRIECSGANNGGTLVAAGFTPAAGQSGEGALTGTVAIDWEDSIRAALDVLGPGGWRDGAVLALQAEPISNPGYLLHVNSNNKLLPELDNDTAERPDILNLAVTLRNMDLSDHILPAANPENTTVNLFDYWVAADGAAGDDDLMQPTDWHRNLAGDLVARSGVASWDQGINAGRLLLFGDGNIHAGYWNKGAGAGCDYGKTHTGMPGIVQRVLGTDGYPQIDTAAMGGQLEGHEGISDHLLCGDHIGDATDEWGHGDVTHHSSNPMNISGGVQARWNGDPSLAYLFDPTARNVSCRRSYTDVQGLFQLDNAGYYYYDMRQNFAQLEQGADGVNRFLLYDAPAVQRTDNSYENGGFYGERSVGNFLPFNTAEQVFDGLDGNGRLYSSERIRTHNGETEGALLNHHLGMTVEITFRQPANGQVNMGVQGTRPMTFVFSGDDDVWIFIDDVLVLDMGGIHSEIYGAIDFASGEVMVGQSWKTNGLPRLADGTVDLQALRDNAIDTGTLRGQFALAGREGEAGNWNGQTFASETSHTLRMFFLERGNYDSSLALRFNLQPLLYQQIKKVGQGGAPMAGVGFTLYPAVEANAGDAGAVQCFYTDSTVHAGEYFYVRQAGSTPLSRLVTDAQGVARFADAGGGLFNFADRGAGYYILQEDAPPAGYRALPDPVVLYYDPTVNMLSVANRWTTGAYACSVDNILGVGQLTYGRFDSASGDIQPELQKPLPADKQRDGLVVAVPMLLKRADRLWVALRGSNLAGFTALQPEERTVEAWRRAVLQTALEQAADAGAPDWYFSWDAGNNRLLAELDDLPGLASRYIENDPGGDMRMVYAFIEPAALRALGIDPAATTQAQRYSQLAAYVRANGVQAAIDAIMAVDSGPATGSGRGFSFLNADQFNRNFRSLIYIPNVQRELRVQKVDQDGRGLNGAQFALYGDPAATGTPLATGTTGNVDGQDGVLVFKPQPDRTGDGYAQMVWADGSDRAYYLRETAAPAGHRINNTVIRVVAAPRAIYADAGAAGDGVLVMAGVGTLTPTMRQYAMDNDVDITLRDIVACMQVQPSGSFRLDGWRDSLLAGTGYARSMDLHYGLNLPADLGVDYGLHDADITGGNGAALGAKSGILPFFIVDEGFIRARVQQNYPALDGSIPKYENARTDTNKDDLGSLDLTNLFSLLNVVVVTDIDPNAPPTGALRISKRIEGENLTEGDYKRSFVFTLQLTGADGAPLAGSYAYYFYGQDKVGHIENGGSLPLHHDEQITILGLPAGARYTVTEAEAHGWFVSPGTGQVSGSITRGATAGADFVNTKDPSVGALSISKMLAGSGLTADDLAESFTFTLRLSDETGGLVTGAYSYYFGETPPVDLDRAAKLESGAALSLRHGEQVTVVGLPVYTRFSVTESGAEGWQPDPPQGRIEGGIEKDVTARAAFVNRRQGEGPAPTPGGGEAGGQPQRGSGTGDTTRPAVWVMLCSGSGAVAAGLGTAWYKKGRRNRRVRRG